MSRMSDGNEKGGGGGGGGGGRGNMSKEGDTTS